MTDISTIPTPDLVRELCSRDKCLSKELDDDDEYYVEIWRRCEIEEDDLCFRNNLRGPARIIVVRGEE